MEFNLQTPAMIFPAISLLMLAYTNRFLTLAGLVRDLVDKHNQNEADINTLEQINNLQIRMRYIRKMQLWGAVAFFLAIVSMLLQMLQLNYHTAAFVFVVSLLFLLISLYYLVKELHISINALSLELETLKKESETEITL